MNKSVGKFLNSSEPQFALSCNGHNWNTHVKASLGGLNALCLVIGVIRDELRELGQSLWIQVGK